MLIHPAHLKDFKCLAGDCPNSCCKQGWEIALDSATIAHYKSCGVADIEDNLTVGADGDRVLKLLPNRVCPYLNQGGLCRLYIASNGVLGEICREYPRFYEEYQGFTETGVSASCPEALRLILEANEQSYALPHEETDDSLLKFLILARKVAFSVIFNEKTAEIAAKKLLSLGYLVQDSIDFGELDSEITANDLYEADFEYQTDELKQNLLNNCEILNSRWSELLNLPSSETAATDTQKRAYLAYLCYRYLLKGINTEDGLGTINAVLGAFDLVCKLPCQFEEAASLFAKEIEHNPENVQAWFKLYETEI